MRDQVHRECLLFDRSARIEVRGPDVTKMDRPGDVLTSGLRPLGTLSYIDVTVTNPMQPSLPHLAEVSGSVAVELKEALKDRAAAAEAVRRAGHHFQPIALNAFGGAASDSLKALRAITRCACTHTGRQYSLEMGQLMQRLGVCINRGSAQMILSRLEGARVSAVRAVLGPWADAG